MPSLDSSIPEEDFPHLVLQNWMKVQEATDRFMQQAGVPEEERIDLLDWGQEIWIECTEGTDVTIEADFSFMDGARSATQERIDEELQSLLQQAIEPLQDALLSMFLKALLTKAKLNHCEGRLRESD